MLARTMHVMQSVTATPLGTMSKMKGILASCQVTCFQKTWELWNTAIEVKMKHGAPTMLSLGFWVRRSAVSTKQPSSLPDIKLGRSMSGILGML